MLIFILSLQQRQNVTVIEEVDSPEVLSNTREGRKERKLLGFIFLRQANLIETE